MKTRKENVKTPSKITLETKLLSHINQKLSQKSSSKFYCETRAQFLQVLVYSLLPSHRWLSVIGAIRSVPNFSDTEFLMGITKKIKKL